VSTHPGFAMGKLRLGGYAEVFLADYYRVRQGVAYSHDSGRYRIVAAGPELSWVDPDYVVGLNGRFVVNATQNASIDRLGDLLGQGVAQARIGASIGVYF
jgi:hypothetical protein